MLKTNAFAKLDLGISISPKKAKDGYFPVRYLDCQIDLKDTLELTGQKADVDILCDSPELFSVSDNFVFKAAELLKAVKKLGSRGVRIRLVKNIPIKAGFGGGSSDAAAIIHALCKLWRVKLSGAQILEIAHVLGKDFYFSYFGKVYEILGSGRDWKMKKLAERLSGFWLVIVVPKDEKPSTEWVYGHLNLKKIGKNSVKMGQLKQAILRGDRIKILENLTNDFEESIADHFPSVLKIRKDLAGVGAKATIMAGAGLSQVGFFSSRGDAQDAFLKLKDKGYMKQIFIAKTL